MRECQIIVFELNNGKFGVDALNVMEIETCSSIITAEDMPSLIKGTIDLRGESVPIVSLNKRFDLCNDNDENAKSIIVTRIGSETVGFAVNQILGLVKPEEKDIDPAPQIIVRAGIKYISGIIKLEDELVSIIDFNALLSENEINSMKENSATR